jgi:rhamnosyl/mannosyltransferase
MRVLQLGKYYEPYVGGIETHLGLLARGLRARGVDVKVLVHNTSRATVREVVEGIPVTRVGAFGHLMSAAVSPGLIRELSSQYDILHLHTPHPMGMLAFLAARTPKHALVVTHHSDIVKQVRAKKLLAPAMRAVMSRAACVIATSARYLESSEELAPHRSKTRVIPYGIDLTAFHPNARDLPAAKALRARFGGRVVLAAGRFIYYKGFEVLLDALQRIRGHLLLVGDGPLGVALKERAAARGVTGKVTFVGAIPNAEMAAYYGACDVFALPSIARSEAFGIVQIEALASGVPVVNTSLQSGVPDVSADEVTGLTVEPGDPLALAAAINRLLDQPEFARRLGDAGRLRALERFTADRMVGEIEDVYRALSDAAQVPAMAGLA